MPATTRATRRVQACAWSLLFVFTGTGCTDGEGGSQASPAPSEGLRAALTQPAPSGTTFGPGTAARESPDLQLGFDCAGVRSAQQRLDDEIADALDRWDVSANSPEGFDATVIVTALNAPAFWRAAIARTPGDMRDHGARVLAHWNRLDTLVAEAATAIGITAAPEGASTITTTGVSATTAPPDVSPTQLHAIRLTIEALARRNGGTAVAQDERTLRGRMAQACP